MLEVTNLGSISVTESGRTREYTEYNVSVFAVSPEAAGEAQLAEALEQYKNGDEPLADYFTTNLGKVEALAMYGIKAQLFCENGNNLAKLMKKAREHSQVIVGLLFGFFMDSPQNGIGSTGWDLIAGNVLAGLDRYREAKARGEEEEVKHSPVLKIMDKISR